MKTTTLDGKTPDIAEENIGKLKQLFPEVFTEGKIDFGKLGQVLGEYVEDSNERYNFTWNGKGRALRLSQTPSLGTLRPCKEESKDWDTTQNLYIEGDNLEVLKLLQKSYYGKVKMIYIDPPYNTGNDFVYKDDFHDSLENYKRITGQVDENGKSISTNTETSGRYHTDWLNMMYPRLRLARNLLADDGVIFISIDDNELDNLKKICNEVFGESNFRNTILTRRRIKSLNSQFADNGLYSMNVGFEYILVYAKSDNFLMKALWMKKGNVPTKGRWDVFWSNADRPTMRYDILGFTPDTGQWRNSKEKADIAIANYQKYITEFENVMTLEEYSRKTGITNFIRRIDNGTGKNGGVQHWIAPSDTTLRTSNWTDIEVSQIGKEIDLPFNNPKSKQLIMELIKLANCQENDIVLDFFSGSATTAHAVMQLNAEYNSNLKFIMVQLPEITDEDSEAFKAGYKNICEIGKERIRRAGEKIKEEKGLEAMNLDVGFKVLKLDTSNIRKWQPDYNDLEQSLMDYIDNYVEGRTELDVVYEIMIKYGLDLTYPVDEFTVAQKKVYSIGFGMLMICLDDEITTDVAKGILGKIKELSPESSRVVFKDNGFKSDSNKTNIKEILKSGGIEEFITI
jgi:adenine-specific DNA-methyltransferase